MRSLLLLPFLLGFSVPAFAHNEANSGTVGDVKQGDDCSYINPPNGWSMERNGSTGTPGIHYKLMRKEGSNNAIWGSWECDGYTGATEWNIKDVDCITANNKWLNKMGKSQDTWCQDTGYVS